MNHREEILESYIPCKKNYSPNQKYQSSFSPSQTPSNSDVTSISDKELDVMIAELELED